MSFAPSNSAVSTPKTAAQMTSSAFVLPAVLPDDSDSLKSLLQSLFGQFEAQQVAHATAVDIIKREAQEQLQIAVDTVKREAQEQVQRLIEQITLARQRMFGASSEQLSAQGRLFDEAEALAQSCTEAEDIAPVPPATAPVGQVTAPISTKPARGKRGPLPIDLQRVDVIHDVAEDQRT